jgi:hypothetical protein
MNGVADGELDGEASAVGVSVGVDVAVAVDVGVGVRVGEGVRVGMRVGVRDGVGDLVAVDVRVAVAVGLGVKVGGGDVDVAAGNGVVDGCRVGRPAGAGAVVAAATAWMEATGVTPGPPGPASRRGRRTQPTMPRTATKAGMAARSAHPGTRRRGSPQAAQVVLMARFMVPQCRQRTQPEGRRALPQLGQMRCPSCITMPQWGHVLARSFASTFFPSSGSRLCLAALAAGCLALITGSCAGVRRAGDLVETRQGGTYLTTKLGFRQVARLGNLGARHRI